MPVEKYEQHRTPDELIIRMNEQLFSGEVIDALRMRSDTDWLLLPEVEKTEGSVELRYNIQGMTSLNEASLSMNNVEITAAVKTLTDELLALPNYGLDISQVITATDQVMVSNQGIRLICLGIQADAREKANARKAILQQIRLLLADRQGMEEVLSFLSNPYCSLQALQTRLQKIQETPGQPKVTLPTLEQNVPVAPVQGVAGDASSGQAGFIQANQMSAGERSSAHPLLQSILNTGAAVMATRPVFQFSPAPVQNGGFSPKAVENAQNASPQGIQDTPVVRPFVPQNEAKEAVPQLSGGNGFVPMSATQPVPAPAPQEIGNGPVNHEPPVPVPQEVGFVPMDAPPVQPASMPSAGSFVPTGAPQPIPVSASQKPEFISTTGSGMDQNAFQPFIPMQDSYSGNAGNQTPQSNTIDLSQQEKRPRRASHARASMDAETVFDEGQAAYGSAGSMDGATVFDGGQPAYGGAGSMDAATVFDGGQAAYGGAGSMDAPTVDDSANQYGFPNNASQIPFPQGMGDNPSGSGHRRKKDKPPKTPKPPKQKKSRSQEERQETEERRAPSAVIPDTPEHALQYDTETYKSLKKAFWGNVIKLISIIAGAVVLSILIGAFLGGVGIILSLLLAAIAIAFMYSKGMINLSWPKKPNISDYKPIAPNVSDVFTVRLRMISQNLATHQEIIIRENNQIVGSDPKICKSPVNYRGISRRHCKISCIRAAGHEEYYITDLHSKNGTRLNGERLEPDMSYPLKLGDHVTLAGKYDFKIGSDAY